MFHGRIIKTSLVVYHSVQLVRTMSSFIRNEETYPFMKNQNTRFVVFPSSIWLPCIFYKFRSIFSFYSRSGIANKKVFAQKTHKTSLVLASLFSIAHLSCVCRCQNTATASEIPSCRCRRPPEQACVFHPSCLASKLNLIANTHT